MADSATPFPRINLVKTSVILDLAVERGADRTPPGLLPSPYRSGARRIGPRLCLRSGPVDLRAQSTNSEDGWSHVSKKRSVAFATGSASGNWTAV